MGGQCGVVATEALQPEELKTNILIINQGGRCLARVADRKENGDKIYDVSGRQVLGRIRKAIASQRGFQLDNGIEIPDLVFGGRKSGCFRRDRNDQSLTITMSISAAMLGRIRELNLEMEWLDPAEIGRVVSEQRCTDELARCLLIEKWC